MRIVVPTPLRSYTKGAAEVDAEGGTLAEVLASLEARHPGMRFRMIDEQERVRQHILFFVNGEIVRSLAHPLSATDEVTIVAALSGGL